MTTISSKIDSIVPSKWCVFAGLVLVLLSFFALLRPPVYASSRLSSDHLLISCVGGEETASGEVDIVNNLSAEVSDLKIVPTCSCTSTGLPTKKLAPRQATKAALVVDVRGKEMPLLVHALLEYNLDGQVFGEVIEIEIVNE